MANGLAAQLQEEYSYTVVVYGTENFFFRAGLQYKGKWGRKLTLETMYRVSGSLSYKWQMKNFLVVVVVTGVGISPSPHLNGHMGTSWDEKV